MRGKVSGMKSIGSAVGREIGQTKPFRTRGQEAVIGLLRTADVVRGAAAALVEPHGVTLQQYNVLRILRGAGPEGLPTLAIAERMIERAPGVTRLIDRLEARSLVLRERGEEDRRQVLCRIAPAGLKLLAGMDEAVDGSDAGAMAGLSAAEQKQLIRLMDRVRAGLK